MRQWRLIAFDRPQECDQCGALWTGLYVYQQHRWCVDCVNRLKAMFDKMGYGDGTTRDRPEWLKQK